MGCEIACQLKRSNSFALHLDCLPAWNHGTKEACTTLIRKHHLDYNQEPEWFWSQQPVPSDIVYTEHNFITIQMSAHFLIYLHIYYSIELKKRVILWSQGAVNIPGMTVQSRVEGESNKQQEREKMGCLAGEFGKVKTNIWFFVLFPWTIMNVQETTKPRELPFMRWDTKHAAGSRVKHEVAPHVRAQTLAVASHAHKKVNLRFSTQELA